MVSQEAQDFFEQLRIANTENKAPFDLEANRLSANAAGEMTSIPKGVVSQDVYIEGVRTLRLTPYNAQPNRVMIFIHGGAFGLMSPESHERLTGHIALECRSVAYIPDYSLAPEHPFPQALNESTRVVSAIIQEASNAGNKTILIGESAGGALALGSTLNLRNKKHQLPECLVFISPWLDLTLSGDSISRNRKADIILTEENLTIFANYYVNGTGFETSDPSVSPLFGDMADIPAIYCQAAGNDILLDDSVRLSEKIPELQLEIFSGMCHSFQFFASQFPEANIAIKKIGIFVERRIS